jgi:hypothetical protein
LVHLPAQSAAMKSTSYGLQRIFKIRIGQHVIIIDERSILSLRTLLEFLALYNDLLLSVVE